MHNADGTATLKGYWGETDDSKKLKIVIGSKIYDVDMTSVEGKNFVIHIPAATIGSATMIEVYHQDYVAAKRSVGVPFIISAHEDPQNAGHYYSTFYSEMNKYQLPEGVEAYVGTVEGNTLALTLIAEAGQVIPAHNAVILKSATAIYSMYASTDDAVTLTATNDLCGVATATDISSSDYSRKVLYTLAAENSTVGFYKYVGNTLGANKAFLPRETEADVKGYVLSTGVETGIGQCTTRQGDNVLFDLSGRRRAAPMKGVMIVNGKKVLVND
ncbi:MAG: hypothetical protein K6A32_09345 [Bacteroidales bacterium]|nr:hypothetical protein [Bacteroidales bacterium]